MEERALNSFENENYRISVYYDEFADSPNGFYDMVGVMLFTYDNGKLHKECDWRTLLGEHSDYNITMKEALKELVWKYVPHDKVIKFLKKGTEHYQLMWNKSKRRWQFWYDERVFGRNPCVLFSSDSEDMHFGYLDSDMLSQLEESDIVELINKYGNDIVVTSLTTYGDCQGEIQEMFAYCTKERFNKMAETPKNNWKEKATEFMQNELKECGCWMWGHVYRIKVEEKVYFTKRYANGEELEDFEYEDYECGQVFYCDDWDEALECVKEDYIKE